MKILTICPSEFLPPYMERSRNHIYFVYDKMALYLGRDVYSDTFCIVEDIPENPIDGMLYITFDGFVKTRINDQIIIIAQIEDREQLNYLKDAGNIYFMKAEYRYLDLHTRTIELPYQNGSFHLSVNLAKEIMIDENTIIRFDPAQQRFIIEGNIYHDEDTLPEIYKYHGSETKSVKTSVDNTRINSEVKISSRDDNLIEVYNNGLYVNLSDKVKSEDFDEFVKTYTQYKTMLDRYIDELKQVVDNMGVTVSPTNINNKIVEALNAYKPTIVDVLENYNTMRDELDKLKVDAYETIEDKFNAVEKEITDYLESITTWDVFPDNEYYEEQSDYLTNVQREVQGMVLEKLREQFVKLKQIEAGITDEVSGDVVIDTERRI